MNVYIFFLCVLPLTSNIVLFVIEYDIFERGFREKSHIAFPLEKSVYMSTKKLGRAS